MNPSRPAGRDASHALYLELAAWGLCLRTCRIPDSMPEGVARSLWEVLVDRRDPDVLAVRQDGGTA